MIQYILLSILLIVLPLFFILKNTYIVKSPKKKIKKNELDEDEGSGGKVSYSSLEGEKVDNDLKKLIEFDSTTYKSNENIISLLVKRSKIHPNRVAFLWLDKEGNEVGKMTYQELVNIISGVAKTLFGNLVKPGDESDERPKALIILPPGLEYIITFFSLLWARVIVVPIYPPADFAKDSKRIQQIAENADAKYIIATKTIYYKIRTASLFMGQFKPTQFNWIYIDEFENMKKKFDTMEEPPKINCDSMAYLQYTSGSTSAPKGVHVSHRNIIANLFGMYENFAPCEKTTTFPEEFKTSFWTQLFWIPPYHDFGLITGVLSVGFVGTTNILYSPLDFLAKPKNWLKGIYKYQPYYTVSPNFGYNLMINLPEKTKKKYPFPKFTNLISGAEPIQPRTMHKFSKEFNHESFVCGFGLAEFTLAATVQKERKLITVHVDKSKFEKGIIKIIESEEERKNYPEEIFEIVSCGKLINSCHAAIVDPETLKERESNEVGELLLYDKMGCLSKGYYKNKEATENTFNVFWTDKNGKKSDVAYLRTGDLSFIDKGNVYICGRSKDLIIIRGRNIYPHDVELNATESHPMLVKNGSIAFSVTNYKGVDEEQLVIVTEVNEEARKNSSVFQQIYKTINQELSEKFGVTASYIILLKEKDLPRTASHKVSRAPCKKLFLDGQLQILDQYSSKKK